MSAPARDDDIKRLVEEATRAAKAAEAAAQRIEREQPSRFAQVVEALSKFLVTLADTLFGRIRSEMENARRAGQELVARVLHALRRTLANLLAAFAFVFLAALFAVLGFIVLMIGLVVLLNDVLGDPYGTLVVAGVFLLVAAVFAMMARGKVNAISREADALSPGWR